MSSHLYTPHLSFHLHPKNNIASHSRPSKQSTPKMSLNNQNSLLTTMKKFTNLLWGTSLPPGLLISTVRTTWNSTWHLMMSQLAPSDPTTGSYSRPTSKFRLQPSQFPLLNPTTLHLYVGLPCPWAHRTLIVRALKGLEEAIPVSIAGPGEDGAWVFAKKAVPVGSEEGLLVEGEDGGNGKKRLREVYGMRRGGYDGRVTVPMLWDMEKKEVVCNESYDILQFFNCGLNGVAKNSELDLAPEALQGEIERWNKLIYPNVNNGVYRCGFAQSQEAYDSAVYDLFQTLDMLDNHLKTSRYLCGDRLTLADVCLFTTLIRFDLVYNVLFKCSKKKLLEYPNLHGYMRDIYQIPKIAQTCNFSAIADGYYKTLFPLNPGGIRPVTPSGCEHEALCKPHNREALSSVNKSTEIFIS